MKGKTNSSGNGGADIKNSQIEMSTALEKIEANNFVEKTIDASIESCSSTPRRYKFPGTDYILIEPGARDSSLGLAVNNYSPLNLSIKVEHPDGTIKTVASIPNKTAANSTGANLAQVLPVSANGFIAVYSSNTQSYNSFSNYYCYNRIISIVVYELDTSMTTATIAVNETNLPITGSTEAVKYEYASSPYLGMCITGAFPTSFDKCFVLSVYRVGTWGGEDVGIISPKFASTLIYCDYSHGNMTMECKEVGCVPVCADLRQSDICSGGSVIFDKTVYQPYSENGIYEIVTFANNVDNAQTTYTRGLYFLRFDILTSSKNITVYPATLIKTGLSGEAAFAKLNEKINSDNTKKLTFVQLPDIDLYGVKNNGTLNIDVELASDGYTNNIKCTNMSVSADTVGMCGTDEFTISAESTGNVVMRAIALKDGMMIGFLYVYSTNYKNNMNDVFPIFFAKVSDDSISLHFKMAGFKYNAGGAIGFSGTFVDFADRVLTDNGIFRIRRIPNTEITARINDFSIGVKKSLSDIYGISKETAAEGKQIKIATLKV